MAIFTTNVQVDFNEPLNFFDAGPAEVLSYSGIQITIRSSDGSIKVYGGSFAYTPPDANGYIYLDLNNSYFTSIQVNEYIGSYLTTIGVMSELEVDGAVYKYYVDRQDGEGLKSYFFRGNDTITGSRFGDVLLGYDGNDTINSGGGLDALFGGAGNDLLNGGPGDDTMVGGPGNDTYLVNNSGDTITEDFGGGIDTVKSSLTFTLGANQERLILVGAATINGTGNELNNIITGNDGANILNGGLGADTMIGGLGNDTYHVDNVGDKISEADYAGTDTVCSSVSRILGANLENLTLVGSGAIKGNGNSLKNVLTGNSGGNVLNGLAGNDTLTGGGGKDSFLFSTAPSSTGNTDTITDFSAVDDTIKLSNAIFTQLATGTLRGKGQFRATGDGRAIDGNDYILYNTSTGALLYDPDGNGSGAATQFAVLENKPTLTGADFVVVT